MTELEEIQKAEIQKRISSLPGQNPEAFQLITIDGLINELASILVRLEALEKSKSVKPV